MSNSLRRNGDNKKVDEARKHIFPGLTLNSNDEGENSPRTEGLLKSTFPLHSFHDARLDDFNVAMKNDSRLSREISGAAWEWGRMRFAEKQTLIDGKRLLMIAGVEPNKLLFVVQTSKEASDSPSSTFEVDFL